MAANLSVIVLFITLAICANEARVSIVKRTNAKAEEGSDPRMFEGDMVLAGGARSGLKNKAALWPGGTVPYTVANTFTSYERGIIDKAMRRIESVSCIKFVPKSNEAHSVHINQKKPGVCFSAVGVSRWPSQDLNLASECLRNNQVGTAIHEMMHAIGFFHEQSRPDRDQFVTIYWNKIKPANSFNFNKYGTDFVTTSGTAYDVDSIMHYESTAFSYDNRTPTLLTKSGKMIYRNNKLSKIDIDELNKLYGCSGSTGGGGNGQSKGKGSCADGHKSCSYWADIGECSKNPNYMLVSCKKSCSQC